MRDIKEQDVINDVIEEKSKVEQSVLYNGYMKKASLKAQMAKQIESLQDQLDYLKKEYEKECRKLDTTKTAEEKSRGELEKLGKEYDELSANIRQKHKKEVDEIHRLQRHLNKTIEEYNALVAQNEEKSRVLDGVRNSLEERENKIEKDNNARLVQYSATEKDLNSQLESILKEKKSIQDNTKKLLQDKDLAEKEQDKAKKMMVEASKAQQEIEKERREFNEYRDREIGSLKNQEKKLARACDEIEYNKANAIDELKKLERKETALLEKEASIKATEKKVDSLIKRYKLEKQIND